jgi:hypothetical protein
MKMHIDEIVDMLEDDDDIIGLWEVIGHAEDHIETDKGEDLQKVTLAIVRRMLSRGFQAGDMARDVRLKLWSDQRPESVISRIEGRWNALGRQPTISEVAYFDHIKNS